MHTETEPGLNDQALAFLISFIATPFMFAIKGAVVVKLWAWFVSPVFPGVPELSFGYAVGICVLAELIIMRPVRPSKPYSSSEVVLLVVLYGFIAPLSSLALGFILWKILI